MSREVKLIERMQSMLNSNEVAVEDMKEEMERYNVHKTITSCTSCDLHKTCGNIVSGHGSMPADIMMVGEAPGAVEDQCGIPFSGPAGKLLDKIIEASGWRREDLYISNIIKCRTDENNRNPTQAEIIACNKHLKKEIELVKPKVIVCWGSVAANTLIHPDFKITHEHGHWFANETYRTIALFHPAYLLRLHGKQETAAKTRVWEAVQKIRRYQINGFKDEFTKQ